MFTGTDTGEHIAMWDVRARTIVYELATGNNSVNAMAWDPVRNCLYAATECNYVDRLGRHYDYRTMKMPMMWRCSMVMMEQTTPKMTVKTRMKTKGAGPQELTIGKIILDTRLMLATTEFVNFYLK
jgi:hypothetical protein